MSISPCVVPRPTLKRIALMPTSGTTPIACRTGSKLGPSIRTRASGQGQAMYRERLGSRLAHVDRHLTQSAYMLGEHFSLADAYLFVWTIFPLGSCLWRRVLNLVCAHAGPGGHQKFEMRPTWGSGTLRSGTKELGLLFHFAGCCFPCRDAPRGQRAAIQASR